VAQRVGRCIALLFHDRGTRRGLAFSSTPRPHFIPWKDPVPILQEAGWAPGLVWTGGKSRPHRDSIPDRPARSQSLYRLSCRAHFLSKVRRSDDWLSTWFYSAKSVCFACLTGSNCKIFWMFLNGPHHWFSRDKLDIQSWKLWSTFLMTVQHIGYASSKWDPQSYIQWQNKFQ